MGLDKDLRQACVYWGLPPRLTEWFRAAIDLDVGLQEFQSWGQGSLGQQRRAVDKQPTFWEPITKGSFPSRTTDLTRKSTFHFFQCNQIGHRVANCPMPPIQPPAFRPPETGGKIWDRVCPTPEQSRIAAQTPTSSSCPTTQDARSPFGTRSLPVVSDDSDDDDPSDPMVSDLICPFVITVSLRNIHTSVVSHQGALIDSGCTQCLI